MNLKYKMICFIKELQGYKKYKDDIFMRKYIRSISGCNEHEFGAVTMDAQTALNELIRFFLGKDWGSNQKSIEELNAIAVYEIETRFYYCKKDNDKKTIKSTLTMTAQDAVNELCHFFLGKGWYVVDPMSSQQVNPIIVIEIEEMYYYCKKDDWEE